MKEAEAHLTMSPKLDSEDLDPEVVNRMIILGPRANVSGSELTSELHLLGLPLTIKETCYGAMVSGKKEDVKKASKKAVVEEDEEDEEEEAPAPKKSSKKVETPKKSSKKVEEDDEDEDDDEDDEDEKPAKKGKLSLNEIRNRLKNKKK